MASHNDNDSPADISTTDGELAYFNYSASLRISGQSLDFEEVSSRLGLTPTHVHRQGERRGMLSPPYKQDMWSYTIPIDEDSKLDEHLRALWDTLSPHKTFLLEIKKKCTVDIFCGYRSNHWGAGIEISPEALVMFTELHIPFGISVIVT
jgi:hypothetical protein